MEAVRTVNGQLMFYGEGKFNDTQQLPTFPTLNHTVLSLHRFSGNSHFKIENDRRNINAVRRDMVAIWSEHTLSSFTM